MVITIGGGVPERQVELTDGFAATFMINDIEPQPTRAEGTGNCQCLTFNATGPDPIVVRIAATPRHPGIANYSVTGGGGAALSAFVWP